MHWSCLLASGRLFSRCRLCLGWPPSGALLSAVLAGRSDLASLLWYFCFSLGASGRSGGLPFPAALLAFGLWPGLPVLSSCAPHLPSRRLCLPFLRWAAAASAFGFLALVFPSRRFCCARPALHPHLAPLVFARAPALISGHPLLSYVRGNHIMSVGFLLCLCVSACLPVPFTRSP